MTDTRRVILNSPWVGASIATLRRVLPLPLVRKAFAGPFRILAGILDRRRTEGTMAAYMIFTPNKTLNEHESAA